MKVDWVPLGEVLRMERTPIDLVAGETYRRIGIFSWGKGMLRREPASVAEMGSMKYFNFPIPSLIFSNIQAWEGAVALAGDADRGFVCSSRFYPYVTKEGMDVDLAYLLEFFRSEAGLALMRRASPGTQVRNKVLSRVALEAAHVPLPTRPDQDRIAAHLARLESAVAAKSVEFGVSAVRAQLFAELGRRGSPSFRLAELVRPRVPEQVAPDRSYAIGGVFGFARGVIRRPALKGHETKYRFLTRAYEGDVVYSKLKAFEGAVAVVSSGDSGRFFSPEFPVLEPTAADVLPGYLEQVLLSPQFLRNLASRSTGLGARRERVHPSKFLELTVPVPRREVQRSVVRLARKADQAEAQAQHRGRLAAALIPATRNEIFSAMR